MGKTVNLRILADCPACGRRGARMLAVQVSSGPRSLDEDPDGVPDGLHAGILDECSSCWQARATALSRARRTLEAAGYLGTAADGSPTWLGALMPRDGGREAGSSDEVECAVASEALRHGVRPRSLSGILRVLVRFSGGSFLAIEPAWTAAATS